MVLSPPILALVFCSMVVGALTVMAAAVGLAAAIAWNHRDCGPEQLLRERRWFLVETSLRLILGLQLFSLVIFVATADHLKSLLTGAMCGVGSLNASLFGPPALGIKTAAFVLCGLWLVIDHASPAAASTGLVRLKAVFLAVIAAVLVAENVLQLCFFFDLEPDIITSCCATIFGPEAGTVAAGLASLPVGWSRIAFFGGLAITGFVGLLAIRRPRTAPLYAVMAAALGLISAGAVVIWIAPAYYELPSHHCPLCLLAPDQGYVGYPLYAFLATAIVTGVGCGVVHLLRSIDRYGCIRDNQERRLCAVSVTSFAAVAALAVWPLVASPFRLEGY